MPIPRHSRAALFVARIDSPTSIDLSLLSREETQHSRRTKRNRRTAEFSCGRVLLRKALERWTGEPAGSHIIRTLDSGRLICEGGPPVSLSHSGEWVVCAIAQAGQIGVDIQEPRARLRTQEIAESFFSPEERVWLASEPTESFYKLWTLKEAYLKALGLGLSGGLRALCCTIEPPVIALQSRLSSAWNLALYSLEHMSLAIAADCCELGGLHIEDLSPSDCGNRTPPRVHSIAASM